MRNKNVKIARYQALLKKYAMDEEFNEFIDLVLFVYQYNKLENQSMEQKMIYNNEWEMILHQINTIQEHIGVNN